MKEYTIGVVVGVLGMVVMAAILDGSNFKNQAGEKECAQYAMASRSNLPVGCYDFFGIK